MVVFEGIASGWKLLTDSLGLVFRKPVFLVPIFFAWAMVACLVLYVRYYLPMPQTLTLLFLLIFAMLFLITLIICVANIMMLEFMQQLEFDKKISFGKAMKEAFLVDLVKVIPIALIWAAVWFTILVIKVLLSRIKRYISRPTPSPQDAALTLSGANAGPFTWLGLGLDMFEKLVRMYVFLTLPAIAWENKGPFSAFGRSLEIIRRHPTQFITAYTLTMLTSIIMAIPIVIIIFLLYSGWNFHPLFWIGVIIYEGFVWTLGIYLEQMSVGLLYLWHLKWLKKGGKGKLSSVPRPNLLDNVNDLK